MTVAKNYTASHKEPSWFIVVMLSGIMSGILLFTLGWYLSLPDLQKDVVVQKIMSAGDIFPGIVGLNRSKVLLVMGVDMPPIGSKQAYSQVRTDTMMLVRLDPAHKKVNIVSIPRDSKVFIPGYSTNKINSAFTLGGADLAVSTVEQTFGIDVDNYLVINTRGVRKVVNALGGIDIYIEKPMHYRDRTAGLNIQLDPGQHHLNGEEAEGFLRFRHDAYGDIGRIRRQQQFIAAVSQKLKDPSVLLKVKPLIDASNEFVITDMTPQEMVRLVLFGKDMKKSNFQVATLPGHPSMNSAISYWIIDPESAETMLNQMIIGIQPEQFDDEQRMPSVGILYTAANAEDIPAYAGTLEQEGFRVLCKSRVRQSNSRLITHDGQLPKSNEEKLLQSSPVLQDAQLIFSPHGATFESNSCANSDYTVILGDGYKENEASMKKWITPALVLALLCATWTAPSHAWFFGKKNKAEATEQTSAE